MYHNQLLGLCNLLIQQHLQKKIVKIKKKKSSGAEDRTHVHGKILILKTFGLKSTTRNGAIFPEKFGDELEFVP